MNQASDKGCCEHCKNEFDYSLVHNGFNESAYAYCNSCSNVSILSGWCESIPKNVGFHTQGQISESIEPYLQSCKCGSNFKASAQPRCPKCKKILSPTAAKTWIEKNAPGTKKGWSWQGTWSGMYCIIINNQSTEDNWCETSA